MRRRHPIPQVWMMTDERQGDRLLPSVRRLPHGAGLVFRHHRLAPAERRALFARIRRAAAARGLLLVWAGSPAEAARMRAGGVHGWAPGTLPPGMIRTVSAHDRTELVSAARLRADAAFLSPLFATRSHPDARGLGRARFGLLARGARLPVVALGGVTGPVRLRGVWGWAAINALTA